MSASQSANAIAGATENNQRLFLRFRKVFSENNPREFAQFAEKLTKWLSDRKAYYEAARPEIIRLLLVAETTLRAALNVPSPELTTPFNVYEHPPHPLIAPYVSMVQTVCRFEDMFEPAFQEYTKRMRANITPPAGHPSLFTMNDKHPPSSSVSQPPKTSAHPLSDPDIQIIDKPQQSPHPDGPPPPYSAHAESMPPLTSQVSAPIRTRKVKKKKTLDFDALAEADIQDALLQQKRAQSADNSSVKAHIDSPLAPVPSPISSVSGTAPPTAQICSIGVTTEGSVQEKPGGIVVSSETKTIAVVSQTTPIARSPEPLVHDAPMTVDSHPQLEAGNSSNMRRDLIAPPTPVIRIGFGNQGNTQQTAPILAQTRLSTPAEGVGLSRLQSLSQSTISGTTATRSQGMTSGSASLPGTQSMDLHNQEQHLLPQLDQSQASMDIDSMPPENADILTSSTKDVKLNEPPLSQAQQQDFPSLPAVEKASPTSTDKKENHSRVRYFQALGEETFHGTHSRTHGTIKSTTLKVDQSTGDTFAGCSVRVIVLQKGPSKGGRITFSFSIKKEEFLGIAVWNARQTGQKPQLRELEASGICISLGCYATDQLAAQQRKEGFDTIEKQLASLLPTWPTGDQVSVDVMLGGQRAKLPLAPPFQVTPDNFVDISQFTSEGTNVIELSHQRDLSRCTFVLLVHNPTQAQLKQVGEQQKRDSEWADWVKDLTKPFSIPLHTGSELTI